MKCSICGRPLDQANDPLSINCGGDCWGCVGEIESQIGYEVSRAKVNEEIEQGTRKSSTDISRVTEVPGKHFKSLHIICTDSEILLSKKRYESWREIQNEYADYKTSLGPWDGEEVVGFLSDEYSKLHPSAHSQVAAFIESPMQVVTLKFRDE